MRGTLQDMLRNLNYVKLAEAHNSVLRTGAYYQLQLHRELDSEHCTDLGDYWCKHSFSETNNYKLLEQNTLTFICNLSSCRIHQRITTNYTANIVSFKFFRYSLFNLLLRDPWLVYNKDLWALTNPVLEKN